MYGLQNQRFRPRLLLPQNIWRLDFSGVKELSFCQLFSRVANPRYFINHFMAADFIVPSYKPLARQSNYSEDANANYNPNHTIRKL